MRWLLLLAILGCGDNDSGGIDASPEADAATATCAPGAGWRPLPALARGPTQETATVAVGDKVYVLGGFNADLAVVPTVQVFDPTQCAWADGPALPQPLHHINATVVGTTIWITGGLQGLSFGAIGYVWSLETSSPDNTWNVHPRMPAGTERGSAVTGAIGTTVYVAGGLRSGAVADVSAFETTTGTWTQLAPLPAIRDHGCGGVIDGTFYVVGGRAGDINALTGSVEAYTPGGAWVTRAAMPTPRGGTACGVIGDRIIVVGGEGNPATASRVFSEVEAFTPATNRWETLTPMASPRHGMGAAVVGGSLYVPGGANVQAFGAVATHDRFTP